jgi:hypothetical protein
MNALRKFPFHFILLLLFFLLHGYSEYVGLIPLRDLLLFFLTGTAIGLLIFSILNHLLKAPLKAGILTSLMFTFYLFYGPIKDALKPGLVSKYSVLLPLMLCMLLLLGYYFRRTGKPFTRVNFFINCLLLIYCCVDMATIISKSNTSRQQAGTATAIFNGCDTCAKPDIHLILLDEYAGHEELQGYFHYDNTSFEQALRERGFFVAGASSSNYSSTPVSMASLFSMDYISWLNGRKILPEDYTRAQQVIGQSHTLQLLDAQGYRFINHSIFDIKGQPGRFKTNVLPLQLKLITSKTMWNSISSDLGWQIHGRLAPRINWLAGMLQDDYKEGNASLLNMTRKEILKEKAQPRFIYTHLMMPHWPYLYDSTGKETGINFYKKGMTVAQKESSYVQYLAYTNRVMLELADSILRQGRGNVAIVLMSDHGYREKPRKQTCREVNNNFVSVYLPSRQYAGFYDSISNVNVFRSLFNSLFQQQFERLPDSCVF